MPPIRTVVADDSHLFVESLIRFLELTPHMEIVGIAHSGREALEQVECLRPDLVLLDLEMPDINGLDVTRYLKAGMDVPCIIVLTFHDTAECRDMAVNSGANGFVSKIECGTELIPMIERLFYPAECDACGGD